MNNFESANIAVYALSYDEEEPHRRAGTEETFDVHHNVFELKLPLTVDNASEPEITIGGDLLWQSCDEQICGTPVRKRRGKN